MAASDEPGFTERQAKFLLGEKRLSSQQQSSVAHWQKLRERLSELERSNAESEIAVMIHASLKAMAENHGDARRTQIVPDREPQWDWHD